VLIAQAVFLLERGLAWLGNVIVNDAGHATTLSKQIVHTRVSLTKQHNLVQVTGNVTVGQTYDARLYTSETYVA